MKKNKLLATLLTATLFTGLLAGCGSSDNAATSAESSAPAAASSSITASSEETSSAVSAVSETSSESSAETDDLLDWEKEYAEKYEITGDEEFTWGFVNLGFTNTFAKVYTDGLVNYAKKAFPNVTVNVGDGELDVNTQMRVCENFITQGIDCLGISAVDSDGCVQICKLAHDNNVPFVVVNSDVNCDVVDHFFIGSDHYYSGQLQAEYLIDNVDDSETVNLFYLGGTDGFTHTTLRRAGVYETLDKAGYNYKVVSDQEGEYLRDKGMTITEDWITRYGDDIDVIVAANDDMAMGALQALTAADNHDVVICGIDANQDTCEAVADGRIAMTVFQDGTNQGKWGAICMYAASKGAEPEFLDVPYVAVTKDNVDEYLK